MPVLPTPACTIVSISQFGVSATLTLFRQSVKPLDGFRSTSAEFGGDPERVTM
jgi:hypothetical protein